MSKSFVEGILCRVPDVGRCFKIRLANFKMNYMPSLCFECFRFHQNLKRRLGAKRFHPLSNVHVEFPVIGDIGMTRKARRMMERNTSTPKLTKMREMGKQVLDLVAISQVDPRSTSDEMASVPYAGTTMLRCSISCPSRNGQG